ncbi:N-acetylneuraminate lyase-like [Ptychodera flava]|uniref:N-acetylneuraminate lyase-like n=1 Tax=Ptychodera flava TaxID=63121 RepID=UPI003969FB53
MSNEDGLSNGIAGISNFKGLVAAPFTPFTEDGDLNLPVIDDYVNALVNDGVLGVFICGTTGEGVSMSVEERKMVAAKWVEAGKDRLDAVVVHVGANCVRDSQTLASHAQEVGASAIAAMPPTFFRPATEEGVAKYLAEIGSAAPKLPLYYYHIPPLTGVHICNERLLEVIDKDIPVPSFRGIKLTSYDMFDLGRCLIYGQGKYHILYGQDEVILAAMTLGAESFIGSTFNYAGKLYNSVIRNYKNGNILKAREAQFRSQAFVTVIKNHLKTGVPFCSINKTVMALCGVNVGPARMPMGNMTKEQVTDLRKDLEEIGFFEWK